MVQKMLDSKFSEFGLVNPVNNSPTCDKQRAVGAKKTPLRDLQNENRVVTNSTGSSPFSRDRGLCVDPIKVSGTKRASPECPLSPSQCQSPSNTAANGHLVYVRRKCETELSKSSAFECAGTSNFQQMRQVTQLEEIDLLKSQIKESKVSCSPAFAPLPMASLTSSSAKPSVPLPLGKSATKLTPLDSNQLPVVATTPLFDNPKGISKHHWEERFYHLQVLLKKLDQSNLEDYTQMLRSSSAVELSRHAVELEKRSIQLSLEEAKELQRVGILNVLGKTTNMAQAPFTQTDQSCK